ncbi:unnamed protein product, partial [Mesorhabditis spiculigera]
MPSEKKKIVVNSKNFWKRLTRLYELWESGESGLSEVGAIYVVVGTDDEVNNYCKSQSFQTWLYTIDLPDALLVMTKKGIWMLASKNKVEFFEPVVNDDSHAPVPVVQTILRNKADKDKENFETLLGHLKEIDGKVGYFAKDNYKNEFCADWVKTLGDIEKVDVSGAFARLFAVKDEHEIEISKESALACCNTWQALRKKYVEYIDAERKISQTKAATEIENLMKSVPVQGNLSKRQIEHAYSPIVQSGGNYSMKWSASSSSKNIHFGVIVTSFGCRLEGYCSNLTRTMMVDPGKELETAYENLLLMETAIINKLVPGVKFSDVYQAGLDALKEQDPALISKLHTKEFGFCTGIEFRESFLSISPKCHAEVQEGMTVIVQLWLTNLKNTGAKDADGQTAALSVGDTVLISKLGTQILTEKARSKLKSVVVRIREDEEEDEKPLEEDLGRGKRSVILTDHTRNKQTNEDKRKERQKELADILNRNAEERIAQEQGQQDQKKVKKSNTSYKSYEKFPNDDDIDNLMVYVDRRHDSVILPLFGIPVPFHISMIKNCSTSIESDFMYLRINFAHPGSAVGKENQQFPQPLATYMKEITLRASTTKDHGSTTAPSNNLNNAFRLIKEMQKKFRMEEAEEREKEGTVKQDKLVLSNGKVNPKLKDLYVRPIIIAKKVSGSLEAHMNGFRYTSLRGDKIDVLYNNIKHAFFQPCNNEMIILIHFHLRDPVLWGKKKYSDIQFYTEVGEITTDLGKYHHMQDRDDVASEQMEREMRRKLNLAFQSFCEKVEKQTNNRFDFETPFEDLGFYGVPFRSSCKLKPTSSCLVNLSEWPPFVISLLEVELVHFERVSFQLKNFDMVFIFKDYRRKTQMVAQIPMNSLDTVKEWLNSCDIKYNEGIQSLNWPKIMKTIVDDPKEFFKTGGWSFLDPNSDDEGEAEESDESEAYDPSEEGGSESGSDEDEDEESDEEASEDDSDDGSASLDSDESSGKDWSDLEEEARKADKRKEIEERDAPSTKSSKHHHRSSPKKRHGDKDRRRGSPPQKKRR